ncbi:MAG TPA: arylsulfatase [Bacteroidales bacterium]|nr:arylsulfatase [Bacteroidales bacterium]
MNTSNILLYASPVIGFFSSNLILHSQNQIVERPNIVIILADDMGYGDVSFNNHLARTYTPNIDKFAENGLTFTDAHSGGSVSIPSRYGLLTGRYFFRAPKQSSYWGYLPPLIEKERETIGTLMQKAGYTTACIGKWHLGLKWGLNDISKPQIDNEKVSGYTNTDFSSPVTGGPNNLGFDYYFIHPASLDMPPYTFIRNGKVIDTNIVLMADAYPHTLDGTIDAYDKRNTNENDIYWGRGVWWRNGEMSKSFKVEDCFDIIVDEGISFIEKHIANNGKNPFMLYLPLTGPHTPWVPNDTFKGSSAMGTYGDFISQVDHVVYRINEVIKRLNIEENTLVIFASDNGTPWEEEDIQSYGHLSNASRRGQKGDIWDGGHHIPLFIKWPAKIKQSQSYDYTISLLDIFASFAEMTGQPIDKKYAEDSFSFYDVLMGNITDPSRDHIVYSAGNKLAIKKGDWKYIDGLGSGGFTTPSNVNPVPNGPKGQLYNLKEDPMETTNLYFQNLGKVKELSDLLHQISEQGFSRY